jgi:hypothetical protein
MRVGGQQLALDYRKLSVNHSCELTATSEGQLLRRITAIFAWVVNFQPRI